jgi:hypothetical protein
MSNHEEFARTIKEIYPINAVPEKVVDALAVMEKAENNYEEAQQLVLAALKITEREQPTKGQCGYRVYNYITEGPG